MKVLISDKINEFVFTSFQLKNIDYDYLPEITPQDLLLKIKDYQALIVRSRTKVTKEIISAGQNLKIIGRVGSGVDNIDTEAAKSRKIIVVNAPDANSQAVAELTIGLILSLLRHIPKAVTSMKNGLWLKKELGGSELSGKTVGIVGYGHVGKKIESIMRAFGAHPLIYSRSFQTSTLDHLFEVSDFVTLHLTLSPKTKGLVDGKLLGMMKPTAYLINASRGEIIDEEALYDILDNDKIAGCALDVFWQEPLPVDSRWRKLDNVILTPHIGASTKEALKKGTETVIQDIITVLKGGKAKNQV